LENEVKMKIVVLDAKTLGDDISLKPFEDIGTVSVFDSTPSELVAERIRDAEIVVLNKVRLDETNLSEASCLKLICIAATGFDNVDTEYAKNNNIAVCNVTGYSTNSVAQLTVSLALSLCCHLDEYNQYCKTGEYTKSGIQNCLTPVFSELSGKTWGVYGYGGIGKKVAEIAKAIGCNIIVCKKNPQSEIDCVSLQELFRRSDVISVHTPLNNDTKLSINAEILSEAKKTAFLINVARGAVLDEEAVTKAVEEGRLAGFATDVYSLEPMSISSPFNRLRAFKNVIFTPHMAWGAYESRVRVVNEIAENIKAFYRGESRNRVD
jgi:glycerate dehydrogenase